MKMGNLDTDTQGEQTPCEDEGRDGDDVAEVRELQIVSKAAEARGETWSRSSLAAPRRNQCCQQLHLGLPASRTVRQ